MSDDGRIPSWVRVADRAWGAFLYTTGGIAIVGGLIALGKTDWTLARGFLVYLLLEIVPVWARWTRRHSRDWPLKTSHPRAGSA